MIPGGDRRDRGIKENHGTEGSQSGEDPRKEPPKAGCVYYADKYPGLGIKVQVSIKDLAVLRGLLHSATL